MYTVGLYTSDPKTKRPRPKGAFSRHAKLQRYKLTCRPTATRKFQIGGLNERGKKFNKKTDHISETTDERYGRG